MVFCSQASSVRQGSCRASCGSPKETILEAKVQEMAKKTQERLVTDVNFLFLKIPEHLLCKIVSNSSEVIACDCLLKGIEPLCVINFCRFVITDLIQDTRHLCTRFRMDGKKAKTRVFQISSELAIFFSFVCPLRNHVTLLLSFIL